MICPNCHTGNNPGAKFCEECGSPLPAWQTPPPQSPYGAVPPQTQASQQKTGKGLIAVLIAAAVALIAVIIVAILALTGLIGKNDNTGDAAADASTNARTKHTQTSSGASTGETAAVTDAGNKTVQLDVTVTRNVLNVTLDTGSGPETIDTITYDLLELDSSAPAALRMAIDEFNSYIEEYCTGYPVLNGPELYEWFTEPSGFQPAYSETVSLEVTRADEAVLSVVMADDSYMGGAHPYLELTGFTFNAENGEQIELSEIVDDRDALARAAYSEMMKDPRLKEVDDALAGAGEDALLELTADYLSNDAISFALTNEGLLLLFSDYMLGSYAAGNAKVLIPRADYEDLFLEAFMKSTDPADDITRHVTVKNGTEETRDLVELCGEAGIDVTQEPALTGPDGTYYFNGDTDLTHITFTPEGTYSCYYATGAVESAGTYQWDTISDLDFMWTGKLIDGNGNTFAEIEYYPIADLLYINDNFYMK